MIDRPFDLSMFAPPGQTVEVRALHPAGPTRGLYVRGSCPPAALAIHVRDRLGGATAEGVYLTPHGRTPAAYPTVAPGAIVVASKPLTTDADVPHRRFLLVDCDRVKTPATRDVSATDGEKAAAFELAAAVKKHMASLGWADPLAIDSGNGCHLYYRLASPEPGGPVADSLADPLAVLLRLLAHTLDTEQATIDTRVYNAARIMKLPGTWARKGPDAPDRPHRQCTVLAVPDSWNPADPDPNADVRAAADALDPGGVIRAGWRKPAASPATATSGTKGGSRDNVVDRAVHYLAVVPSAIGGTNGEGEKNLLNACRALVVGFQLDTPTALGLILAHYNTRAEPPFTVKQVEHKLEQAATKPFGKPAGWLLADTADDLPNAPAYLPDAPEVGQQSAADDAKPPPAPTGVNYAPDDPGKLARVFLARYRRLVYWRQEFHAYTGTGYEGRLGSDFTAEVNAAVRRQFEQENKLAVEQHAAGKGDGDPPVMTKVTRTRVNDTVGAMEGMCRVPGLDKKDAVVPAWLGDPAGRPDPRHVVVAANGLIDFPRYVAGHADAILPHTPDYFAPPGVPYRVDPAAPVPARWDRFTHETWPDDPASIAFLQEWFGYCLTADTSRQKMLMLIGRSGGGKGTVLKVLTALLGTKNVASPNLHDFDQDGLHDLVGKPVAIVADAQSGGLGMNAGVIVQNLLKISGEDEVTIRRKYLNAIKVKLPCRLVFAANEVIRLPNTAGAFARRWCVLRFTTHPAVPDETLKDQLTTPESLAGIFNWAAAGWARLQRRGRFTATADGEAVVAELVQAGSAVAEFVADRCVEGVDKKVPRETLFRAWQEWRKAYDLKAGTPNQFGRDLLAFRPDAQAKQVRIDGKRVWHYMGLDLAPSDPLGWGSNADRLPNEQPDEAEPEKRQMSIDEDLN